MAIARRRKSSPKFTLELKITEHELMRLPKDGRKWELRFRCGGSSEVPTEWEHDLISIRLILRLHTRFGTGT